MSSKDEDTEHLPEPPARIGKREYRERLHGLHIELVKLQKHFIACGDRILILIEGRDAAGKDGVIKRIREHLSPRDTRVVAPGMPSDRDRTTWYFQRYAPYLPAAGEFVVFNRSWYNRAGVERVMGYCTQDEYEEFMETAPEFEHMLVRSGIKLLKYYLDITRDEQARRLEARRKNPLKQWKISPVDQVALAHWDDYSTARNQMLARTHNPAVPWTVVRADSKRAARLNLIADLLLRLHYNDKNEDVLRVDPDVLFRYQDSYIQNNMIAP